MVLAAGSVLFSVDPGTIDPDVTQNMTLLCQLADPEEFTLVGVTISRETFNHGALNKGAKHPYNRPELIASLVSSRPTAVEVSPRFQHVTATGGLSTLEAENEAEAETELEAEAGEIRETGEEAAPETSSALSVVWPSPGAQDLGLYTCHALVLGERPGQTLTLRAVVRVTTSNVVSDRLLLSMNSLHSELQALNSSVVELSARLDALTNEEEENSNNEEEPEVEEEPRDALDSLFDPVTSVLRDMRTKVAQLSGRAGRQEKPQ